MNRDVVASTAALRRIGRWLHASPEELAAHRADALRAVVAAALTAEPYARLYPRLPSLDRVTLDDLPVTDRASLGAVPLERRSTRPLDGLLRAPSTGTTGHTMVTLRTGAEEQHQRALAFRQLLAQGLPRRSKRFALPFALDPTAPAVLDGNVGAISGWAPLEAQTEAVRTFRPDVLIGPGSCLVEIGQALGGHPVEMLMTSGETLTSVDRAELRRLYGTAPVDLYSTSEAGHLAWQCRGDGPYHVNADAVIVEILDDDDRPVPDGVVGHVVLTALWNRTTPTIRYRVGDMASVATEPCACGVTLPSLAAVDGRSHDRPVAHDGQRVSSLRFALAALGPYHDAIRRWRVVQRAVDDMLVEVVWTGDPVPGLRELMQTAWSRVLRGPVEVELRSVDRLSHPGGRKFRWMESLVEAPTRP